MFVALRLRTSILADFSELARSSPYMGKFVIIDVLQRSGFRPLPYLGKIVKNDVNNIFHRSARSDAVEIVVVWVFLLCF